MSWRILYVEDSEKLSLYLDNIKIIKGDNEYLIPISDLHTVILDNYKILLSVHLINALSKSNVNVVLCGVDHLPQTVINPFFGNALSPLQLRKQIDWSEETKGLLHQQIIKNKIKNQLRVLKYFDTDKESQKLLERYHQEVEMFDLTNREGLSAKVYFRSLFGEKFKRFEDDVINSGLNYGYAILRSQISKSIIAKGLNPTLGIFHIGRNNFYNLSDDIIEVFRPIIDVWVKKNLQDAEIFTREHRHQLIQQSLQDAVIKHQKQSIFNTINIFLDNIINSFEYNENEYVEVELMIE